MSSTEEKPVSPEITQLDDSQSATNMTAPDAGDVPNEDFDSYRMSWRTFFAFISLCFSWASTSFGVSGPNSAISYMVASFPTQAANASWIANTGLFCIITICPITGTVSDRYGKRTWLLVAPAMSVVGAVVCGSAKNINTIIGGQALVGVGSAIALVSVASTLEIVPARLRPLAFGAMSVFNVNVGAMGSSFVFGACVKHNLGGKGDGWRWGFYLEAILFAIAFTTVFFFYNPPPTRFRRQQTVKELLRSIDFIGIAVLDVGAAMLAIALLWGGVTYPWGSSHVVPFLVLGPLLLIAFCVYEWKGRSDGLLHHGFFWSRNFPILMVFGAVDGILLYALSVYIPDQVRALYTRDPVTVARVFASFQGALGVGYLFFGFLITKLKRFRIPLILTNIFTTLFCGLLVRATPHNRAYYEGMLAMVGLCTAATTVVPVAGIGLVVPSHLIGTSNLLLAVVRALGGTLGLTIFSAVYNNKAAVYVPAHIIPITTAAKLPAKLVDTIIKLALEAPAAIATVPGIPPATLKEILASIKDADAEAYSYIWYCIMAAAAACLILAFFLEDVPERMDNSVESAMEKSKVRAKQDHVVEG